MNEKSAFDALGDVRRMELEGKRYVVVKAEEWENFIERVEDLEDVMTLTRQYNECARQGKDFFGDTIPWEQAKKELGWDDKPRRASAKIVRATAW